jgi:hypothetical protein
VLFSKKRFNADFYFLISIYIMSVQSFLINNKNRNPNEYISKFGKSIEIPAGSEICVSKCRLQNVIYKNINSSNDTFVLLWGQYDLDNNKEVGVKSACSFLPPEKFELKHGEYLLIDADVRSIVDDKLSQKKNIIANLVTTLNNESRYFMWGWAGQYNAGKAYLTPYLKYHNVASLKWDYGILNANNSFFSETIVPETGTHPEYSQIVDDGGSIFYVSDDNVPFPYSVATRLVDLTENPRTVLTIELQPYTSATDSVIRGFGGFIMEEQEFYKNDEAYDDSKDWVGLDPLVFDPTDVDYVKNIENFIPISWEIGDGNEIIFTQYRIENGETTTDVIKRTETGVIYDGANEIKISFIPYIANSKYDNALINECTARIDCWAGVPGAGFVYKESFYLDTEYFKYNWRNAMVWSTLDITDPAVPLRGAIPIETYGVEKAMFVDDITRTLGSIDSPNAPTVDNNTIFGNISATMFFDGLKQYTVLGISPNTTINYNFQQALIDCNVKYLEPAINNIYNFDTLTNADDMLEININSEIGAISLSLNIDNLPIDNYICGPDNGKTQKRIYTIIKKSTDELISNVIDIVDEPRNLLWTKLTNKSSIVINNFQLRWSNLDGSACNSLDGSCDVEILIRSNRQIKHKASAYTNDNIDRTEENFKMAQNVF